MQGTVEHSKHCVGIGVMGVSMTLTKSELKQDKRSKAETGSEKLLETNQCQKVIANLLMLTMR